MDAEEKFAPVMPAWSAYAGEAFNLTERRPLAIVAETDDAFVVEGFYHRAEFWRAAIPRRGVAEIIGQRFNFSKQKRKADGTSEPSLFFANHVQARLRMEPEHAVRLYRETDALTSEPAHRVTDFCYSVEAVGPYGRKWNLSDALLGNLAIVHRFLSTEDVAFERIMRERMTVLQSHPLPLEGAVRQQMLAGAIRESHTCGLTRPYFMVRLPFTATNCTSEPLKLLDGVLNMPRWQRTLYRFPIHPRGYLKLRGLWPDGPPAPTLNEQMQDWLTSESAKQRRQIHVEKKHRLPKEDTPSVSWRKNASSFFNALRA